MYEYIEVNVLLCTHTLQGEGGPKILVIFIMFAYKQRFLPYSIARFCTVDNHVFKIGFLASFISSDFQIYDWVFGKDVCTIENHTHLPSCSETFINMVKYYENRYNIMKATTHLPVLPVLYTNLGHLTRTTN